MDDVVYCSVTFAKAALDVIEMLPLAVVFDVLSDA